MTLKKHCETCGSHKPISEFDYCGDSQDHLQDSCAECIKKYPSLTMKYEDDTNEWTMFDRISMIAVLCLTAGSIYYFIIGITTLEYVK